MLTVQRFQKLLKDKNLSMDVLAASPLWGYMVKEKNVLTKINEQSLALGCEVDKIYDMVAKCSPKSNYLNSSSILKENDGHSVHLVITTLKEMADCFIETVNITQVQAVLKKHKVTEDFFALEVMPHHTFPCLTPEVKEHYQSILHHQNEEKSEQARLEQERKEALAKEKREQELNSQVLFTGLSREQLEAIEAKKKAALQRRAEKELEKGQTTISFPACKIRKIDINQHGGMRGYGEGGYNSMEAAAAEKYLGQFCATCGGPAQLENTDFGCTQPQYSCWKCNTKEAE